ncbi:c-type cytochrome [Candidatus Rariloculus sp.]|uniref:c-type cytochrome n=1 Tax=Candidatus Rariloculus sp. TaxID=3101265 RepID=UPI003D0B2533
MSTHRLAAGLGALMLGAAAPGTLTAQAGPGLGVELSAEQIAAWDINIAPDGTGLPPGSGDARTGAEVYALKCVACHAVEEEGGLNDRLTGGHGSLAGSAPVRTVGSYWPYATTIFDYIRRAMPFTSPQSLTDDETYALTAYLLQLNGIIGEDDVMDATTLPSVEMPNRDGFVLAYPPAGQ